MHVPMASNRAKLWHLQLNHDNFHLRYYKTVYMQRNISNGSVATVTDEQHQCRSRPRPLLMNRAGSAHPRPPYISGEIHQWPSLKRRPPLMNHASVTVALTRPLLMYPLLSVMVAQFPTATYECRGLNTKNRAAAGRDARRNGPAATHLPRRWRSHADFARRWRSHADFSYNT